MNNSQMIFIYLLAGIGAIALILKGRNVLLNYIKRSRLAAGLVQRGVDESVALDFAAQLPESILNSAPLESLLKTVKVFKNEEEYQKAIKEEAKQTLFEVDSNKNSEEES